MLLVAIALWVPLAALITGIVLRGREAQRIAVEARLQSIAHNVAVAVDASLQTQLMPLLSLARSVPPEGPFDREAFLQRARIIGEALGGGVLLLYGPPPNREPLANTGSDPELLRARIARGAVAEATAEMVARIVATGRPALSDLFPAPLRPVALASIGVAVPGGPLPGRRLHMAFEPVAIRDVMTALQFPSGVRVTIRDRGFRVIASTDAARSAGPAENFLWVPDRLGDAGEAVLTGPGPDGGEALVAVERLTTDPGWFVMVDRPRDDARGTAVSGIGWPIAGGGLLVLGIVGVVWAARREGHQRLQDEADLLRDAQRQVTRLHDGLPAMLVLRRVTPDGRSAGLLYRAGDADAVLGWPMRICGRTRSATSWRRRRIFASSASPRCATDRRCWTPGSASPMAAGAGYACGPGASRPCPTAMR